MRWSLGVLALLLTVSASADNTPRVRVELEPETVTVGESIRMRVTVLSPTWFPRPPEYPSFDVTNAIVRLPPDSSRPSTERVDGESWSGIVRNYEVIPLVGARFVLDELSMEVTYADPVDFKPVKTQIAIPPIEFAATVPAGAEGLSPYVAGRRLTLERELDREPADLEAGDALVVTYTATLDGLPSMFLPDFVQAADQQGVTVYAAEPRFEDADGAVRREQLTFVFEGGGDFELPAVQLDWWNIDAAAIETASLPGVTVSVVGPPVATAVDEAATREVNWFRIAAIMLVVLLAIRPIWHVAAALMRRRDERRQQALASEAFAFGQLQEALSTGDAPLSYARLLEWIRRLGGVARARALANVYGDAALTDAVMQLRASLYADSEVRPDLTGLGRSLAAAYNKYQQAQRQSVDDPLPALNP